jgi:hypothetical protein
MFSPYRRFMMVCLSAVLFACVAPVRTVASDFKPIPPEELQIKEVPGQPNAPAIVLFHEELADDVMHFQSVYTRLKVLTEAGRKYADVQLAYSSKFALSSLDARTIHADGSIVEFDGDAFVKSHGGDDKASSFTLPDVQVGSIIEYRYVTVTEGFKSAKRGPNGEIRTVRSFNAPYWRMQTELFQKRVHYSYRPWNGQNTGEQNMRVESVARLPKGVNTKLVGDKTDLVMTDIPPFVEEEHMPPADTLQYDVRFYEHNLDRGAYTNNDYWKMAGDRWNDHSSQFLSDKKAMRNALAQIVQPTDTAEQKVRKIYAFIGTFTNLTYQQKLSDQEAKDKGLFRRKLYCSPFGKWFPDQYGYTDEPVLRNKMGTREDLTWLFVGLVREAGIPASLMRVTARDQSYFTPEYPECSQLDNELAIVTLDGKEQFLDPGTLFAPYGQLHWKSEGARGIRQSASGHGTEVASTPPSSYKTATIKRLGQLRVTEQGSVTGTIKVAYFGQEALVRRLDVARRGSGWRKRYIEDELKKLLPADSQVSLTNEPAYETSADPLLAEYKVTIPLATSSANHWTLPMQALHFNQPTMFVPADRVNPVYLDYPYIAQDEMHITLPSGMTVESAPAKELLKPDFGYYSTDYKQKDRELVATRVLAVSQNLIAVDKYPALKTFFDKVKAADDQKTVLTGNQSPQGTAAK